MRPHTVGSADEALETLRRAHYDLAVIDVMMPGRDGLWLATQMRRDHPHTAVVMSTAAMPRRFPVLPHRTVGRRLLDQAVSTRSVSRWRSIAAACGGDTRSRTSSGTRAYRTSCISAATTFASCVRRRADQGGSGKECVHELVAECLADTARPLRTCCALRAVRRPPDESRSRSSIAALEAAALFRDIGKIAVPTALLTKPSPR